MVIVNREIFYQPINYVVKFGEIDIYGHLENQLFCIFIDTLVTQKRSWQVRNLTQKYVD